VNGGEVAVNGGEMAMNGGEGLKVARSAEENDRLVMVGHM